MKLGFVDVGGGTRGIYGAGVFDYLMEENISGDYFIGVSAGAANGASFLANQPRRNFVFYNKYAFRKEYMSFKNYLKTGSYIDLDYIYSDLSSSKGEYPLDYKALKNNPMDFEIVATDARTGKAKYFKKSDLVIDNYDPIKASCCVPVLNQPYKIKGVPYFDGGISDPIPFKRAFEAGCDKVIIVLTRPRDYFREGRKDKKFVRLLRRTYPKAAKAFAKRSLVYNESLREAMELEKENKVIIVAPSYIGNLKTLTQDHDQLENLYELGRKDAKNILTLENIRKEWFIMKMKALKEKIKSERENFRDSNKNLDENDKAVKNRFKKIQIVALISFASILIVLILTRSGNVSIDSLTEKAAGNPKKSIITLISLFAVKSLTIIIPLPSLYVASGILFDPLKAVAVSYLGLAVTLTIPFILGRWSGTEEIHYIKKKYPKIEKVIEMQERNEFLASFIIRLIGWFPCDVLSFYFGACKTNYLKYITSSLLGASIGVITNTLLGDVILNPLSWQFMVMLVIKILISVSVVGITYLVNKDKNPKK